MTNQNKPVNRPTANQHPEIRQPGVQQRPTRPQQPMQGQRPMQGMQQRPMRPQQPMQGQRPMKGMQQRPMRPQQPMQGQRPLQQAMSTSVPPQQANMAAQQTVSPVNTSAESQLSPVQLFLSNSRNFAFVIMGAIILGILLGAMMFGGSSQPIQQGLQNIVRNPDIRQKLPLCGRTGKGQACVLYIMNTTRYDQLAENFFNVALKLTEVPLRSISWANPKYAKQKIHPGFFAEISIPNIR